MIERFDLAGFEALAGDEREEAARRLDGMLSGTGFLLLTGHGVPFDTIEEMRAACAAFFAQDAADKERVRASGPYGWIGAGAEALAKSRGEDTPPDLKESFNGGPPDGAPAGERDADALRFVYADTPMPDLQGFEAAWLAYYREMEILAGRIMAAFAEALGRERDFFERYFEAPISALRALHYPATEGEAEAGQQRAGAHTDYGSLTILLPDDGSDGLEADVPGRGWVPVSPPPGCFVVNIGDLMALWTGGQWRSTLHRVVHRPAAPARKSIAFFQQPDWHAEVMPLDGSEEAVRSGPYLMAKFAAANA